MRERLGSGDLRSIGKADEIVLEIKNQKDFDVIFNYLYDEDRLVRMRAIDVIEKITIDSFDYLKAYKKEIIKFSSDDQGKEFKWHLALLLSRIELSSDEEVKVVEILKKWAIDPKESKIVRVNSIESLFKMSRNKRELEEVFLSVVEVVEKENIPSINARIRKILSK